jgi:threonine/homoserine/homoserine lactone efflux protein
MNVFYGSMIVLGVFAGTLIWWVFLLGIVEYMKKKKSDFNTKKMNQFFGVIFIIFAIVVFVRTFVNIK